MDERTKILLFDDGRGRFGPLTDMRPVFDIRTGELTTRDRIERVMGRRARGLRVDPAIEEAVRRHGRGSGNRAGVNEPLGEDEAWLIVNGRWLGVDEVQGSGGVQAVRGLELGQTLRTADGELVAAHLMGDDAEETLRAEMAQPPLSEHATGGRLITRPWHILNWLERTIEADLAATGLPPLDRDRPGAPRCLGSCEILVHPTATISPTAVLDATRGPIALHESCRVEHLAVIEGPASIGPGSGVAAHAVIRTNTIIGPVCKVAGEIVMTVMQGYSNKGHAGFLGHALLGQWVNLGADTTVSNLKNTYGHVRMTLTGRDCPSGEEAVAEDTGRMFTGPVIGDYVRTAIGTLIPTGACLGTGCMIASTRFAPKAAQPMGFYVDEHGQTRHEYQPDKFITTAQAMMARRDMELTAEDEAVLRGLAGRL